MDLKIGKLELTIDPVNTTLFLGLLYWAGSYMGVAIISVALHELGHALTAAVTGIRITGWGFNFGWQGFGARIDIPRDTKPGYVALIALAGPVTNAALAAGCWLVYPAPLVIWACAWNAYCFALTAGGEDGRMIRTAVHELTRRNP